MDRMARDTKQPEVLRELFEALGNDPFVIAECLAKPTLVERNVAIGESTIPRRCKTREQRCSLRASYVANANYTLPTISAVATGCTP